jgi:hypothetical protein
MEAVARDVDARAEEERWRIVWLLGLRQVVVKSELSNLRRLSKEGSRDYLYIGSPTSSRFLYMTHYLTAILYSTF